MTLTRKQKILRFLILIIPYLIYIIRMVLQIIDEFTQHKTGKLLGYLDLIPQPEPEKTPII